MSPNPSIYQLSAVIWTPDELQQAFPDMKNLPDFQHHTVVLEVPHMLLHLLADITGDKTCLLVELRGDRTGVRYAVLTMQVGDTQLAVVAPLESTLAMTWFLQALEPNGRFRFLLEASDSEDVAVMNVPYLGERPDAASLSASLDVAPDAGVQHSSQLHRAELRAVVRIAEMEGYDGSLIDDVITRERHVVVVQPADWPPGASADGSMDEASGTDIVQCQLLH
ncbi:hypothetical protein GALL_495430 [mine drainage metagenome]|uniref:Uncharacterized protein n=1 Tax=mine drainage metagenome TaxID=410659 RepID=A0A1J5PMP1_9ZZZZ